MRARLLYVARGSTVVLLAMKKYAGIAGGTKSTDNYLSFREVL